MIRNIITIDEEKCNGCGLCAAACHEGAIGLVNGKATLLRDDYCDGLGACLPACPTGAIALEERDAAAFDEAAVQAKAVKAPEPAPAGCPGSQAHALHGGGCPGSRAQSLRAAPAAAPEAPAPSQLAQWPVQIKLAAVNAPFFDGAHLLVAADCAAYAHGDFHRQFMRGRVTLIGCPKLDQGDYGEKLTAILQKNRIKSVTVARMEVPCCGGLERAVVTALQNSGKMIPWQVVTLSTNGEILEND